MATQSCCFINFVVLYTLTEASKPWPQFNGMTKLGRAKTLFDKTLIVFR